MGKIIFVDLDKMVFYFTIFIFYYDFYVFQWLFQKSNFKFYNLIANQYVINKYLIFFFNKISIKF